MAIKILVFYGHGTERITKTFRSHFNGAAVEFFDYHSDEWKDEIDRKVMELDGVIINSTSNPVKADMILKSYNQLRVKNGICELPYISTWYVYQVEKDCETFIENLILKR